MASTPVATCANWSNHPRSTICRVKTVSGSVATACRIHALPRTIEASIMGGTEIVRRNAPWCQASRRALDSPTVHRTLFAIAIPSNPRLFRHPIAS